MYQQISIQYSCSFFMKLYEIKKNTQNDLKKTLMSYTCNSIASKMCYVLKYAISRQLLKKDISNFHYLNMSLFLSSHRNITRWVE